MNLRQNLKDIYSKVISNEKILRLLHYGSNPLDTTSYSNIIGSTNYNAIADAHVFWTPKTTDLVNVPTCRICLYAGRRDPLQYNYATSIQDFIFDIYVHIEQFDQKDLRLTWISDEVNELISQSRVTGMGKVEFVAGSPINAPEGYVGYRLVYSFGSGN